MSEGLRVERDGAVTTVVLDRPGRLNALSYDLIRGLARTLEELRGDPAQRVVLLTAPGEPQRGHRPEGAGRGREMDRTGGAYPRALRHAAGRGRPGRGAAPDPAAGDRGGRRDRGRRRPVARLRGRHPHRRARRHVHRVVRPARRLRRRPGQFLFPAAHRRLGPAAELLYTGRTVEADEAMRIGLVTQLVPAGEGLATARSLAAEMLAVAPMSTRMTKSLLNLSRDGATLEQMIEYENRTQILLAQTEDFAEGVSAFAERRPARFEDR
ncbi:MAG TPA: enoyl-CoA hydratase-related protein [Streptosporangiaceae bacterium]